MSLATTHGLWSECVWRRDSENPIFIPPHQANGRSLIGQAALPASCGRAAGTARLA
jgi:hypothetical protein